MSTPPGEHELIDFVYHEARLLDEKRFEEWYELFTEDGLYWMPLTRDQSEGRTQTSLFYEDRLLLNARLTYRTADENWQVALEVKNLTDKLYYNDVFDNRGSTNSIQGSPGMPRTWAVTVKHNFN